MADQKVSVPCREPTILATHSADVIIKKPGGYILAIMRLWHGEVALDKADEYEKFMIDRAAPDYASVDGLLKQYFQRRNEKTRAHFLLVTIWDSLESIKKFAGAEPELAKYYPEDDNFLLKKEKFTSMYEVFYER